MLNAHATRNWGCLSQDQFQISPCRTDDAVSTVACRMYRACATILFAIVSILAMLPGMDGQELVRLGSAVAHYHHHVEQHGQQDLSLAEFITEHYGTPASNQQEPWEHHNLPLQHGSPTVFVQALPTKAVPHPLFAEGIAVPSFDGQPYGKPISRTLAVFQPPRG